MKYIKCDTSYSHGRSGKAKPKKRFTLQVGCGKVRTYFTQTDMTFAMSREIAACIAAKGSYSITRNDLPQPYIRQFAVKQKGIK